MFQKYKHSFPEVFDLFNIFLNAHMHCKLYSQHSPFKPRPCCVISSLSARKLAGIPCHIDIWYQMAAYHFFVISNVIFLFFNISFRLWLAVFTILIYLQIFLFYLLLSFKILPMPVVVWFWCLQFVGQISSLTIHSLVRHLFFLYFHTLSSGSCNILSLR